MSQTGYTPIQIYSSSTTGNTPSASNLTNSTLGSELAINITAVDAPANSFDNPLTEK